MQPPQLGLGSETDLVNGTWGGTLDRLLLFSC